VKRLTLRAAWWLHYWQQEMPEAAMAVSETGVTFTEAFALTSGGTTGIISPDASTSA
jgi:hypothetical protein